MSSLLRWPPGHAERDHPAPDPGAVQQDLPGGQTGGRDHLQGFRGPHAQDHLEEMVQKVSTIKALQKDLYRREGKDSCCCVGEQNLFNSLPC